MDGRVRTTRAVRRRPGRLDRIRVGVLYASLGLVAVHMWAWYGLGWRSIGKLSFSGFASLAVGHVNMATVFCLVVLASLLVAGRVMCGWFCKLSALQELTEALHRRIGFAPTFIHTRARTVRVFILIPYLLPVLYTWEDVGLSTRYVDLGAVEPWTGDLPKTVLFSTFYFVSITLVLTALFGRRAFCRLVCMFGLVFSLAERLPWVLRIRQKGRCVSCDACAPACPMGIDVPNEILRQGRVTHGECIRCMACVDVCPVKALGMGVRAMVPVQEPLLAGTVQESALPVGLDATLATLAVIGGVWAATHLTGFHVFLGASWGLIAGILAWNTWWGVRRLLGRASV